MQKNKENPPRKLDWEGEGGNPQTLKPLVFLLQNYEKKGYNIFGFFIRAKSNILCLISPFKKPCKKIGVLGCLFLFFTAHFLFSKLFFYKHQTPIFIFENNKIITHLNICIIEDRENFFLTFHILWGANHHSGCTNIKS